MSISSETREKIMSISIADSVHDFGASLIQTFINKHVPQSHIDSFKDNMEIKKLYEITGFKENDSIDFNEIDKEYILSKSPNQNGKISFAITTNNINDPKILSFIGLAIGSYEGNKQNKLLTADHNNIPHKTLCSINIDNEEPVFQYSITNATIYDKGFNVTKDPENCFKDCNQTAELSKDDGNLFELEKIETGDGDDLLKLEHRIQSDDMINIKKNDFLNSQSSDAGKFLTLFERIIENFISLKSQKRQKLQEGGGGRKRKRDSGVTNVKPPRLIDLLQHLEKTYQIDYKKIYNIQPNFADLEQINSIENSIKKDSRYKQKNEEMVAILLDLKRAGDQLQVKTAKNLNSVFISNDRLAIAYGYMIDVPCIKPAMYISEKGEKGKKICFYNFDPNGIKTVFENVDYYKRTYQKQMHSLENYANFLETFKTRFIQIYGQDKDQTNNIKNKLKMYQQLLNVIESVAINPMTFKNNQDVRDELRMQTMYLFRFCKYISDVLIVLLDDMEYIEFINNENSKYKEWLLLLPDTTDGLLERINAKISDIEKYEYYRKSSFVFNTIFEKEDISNYIDYIFDVLAKQINDTELTSIENDDFITDEDKFQSMIKKLHDIYVQSGQSIQKPNMPLIYTYIAALRKWHDNKKLAPIPSIVFNENTRKRLEIGLQGVYLSEFRKGWKDILKLLNKIDEYDLPKYDFTTHGGRSMKQKKKERNRYKKNEIKKADFLNTRIYAEETLKYQHVEHFDYTLLSHKDLLREALQNQQFDIENDIDNLYKIILLFIANQYLDENGFFDFEKQTLSFRQQSSSTKSWSKQTSSSATSMKLESSRNQTSSSMDVEEKSSRKQPSSSMDIDGHTGGKSNVKKPSIKNHSKIQQPVTHKKQPVPTKKQPVTPKKPPIVSKQPVIASKKSPPKSKKQYVKAQDKGILSYFTNVISNVFGTFDNKTTRRG